MRGTERLDPKSMFLSKASQSSSVSFEKTQEQPEASNPVQHVAAARPGEEVPSETVSVHRGTGRVLQFTESDRDTGQDLVPEQTSKSQETPRGRAGETENGHQADAPSGLWDFGISSGRSGVRIASLPQTLSERDSDGTVHTYGIQHVSFSLSDSQTETQREEMLLSPSD